LRTACSKEPYLHAVSQLPALFDRHERLARDNPAQEIRAQHLASIAHLKPACLRSEADLVDAGHPAAAARKVAEGECSHVLGQVRH